jgi:uncharacterized DUF497 family protein
MEFEWDDAKSERNHRERGFDFATAALIFDGPVQTTFDDRRDYSEERVIAIGEINGEVLVAVYTDRGQVRRIISARRANRKERETWRRFAKRSMSFAS